MCESVLSAAWPSVRVVPTADVNPHDNFLWGLSLRVSFVVFAFVLF